MSKASKKENKCEYQLVRESLEMSRADVEDATNGALSASRLDKIENNIQAARPEDIVLMSKVYNEPRLCNYYCAHECEIGKINVPSGDTVHDLPQITMKLLSNLNSLNNDKERIIDIAADGEISEDERKDFEVFQKHLSEMSMAIETLKIWANKKLS